MYEFEKKKLLSFINDDVLEILKEEECIIAGGCITSLFTRRDINDIDIYFRSKKSLISALRKLDDECTWMAHTDKATLFVKNSSKYAYQFIHFKFFEQPSEIFNTFDFSVCTGAYDFKINDFVFDERFFQHNSQKILKFNENTAYPIVSALRVQKYIDKGYSISKPEYIKIMLTINQLKINTYEELKEQMGGMYGVNYDKLFNDIEGEFNICKIISKISDLILDDDYFKLPSIDQNIDIKIKRFINSYYLNGNYKIIKKNRFTKDYYLIVDKLDIVDIISTKELEVNDKDICTEDILLNVYKNVSLECGKYYSGYDKNFEYILNQVIEARNNIGLFFNINKDNVDYYAGNRSIKLKATINSEDIIEVKNSHTITVSKCIPVECISTDKK